MCKVAHHLFVRLSIVAMLVVALGSVGLAHRIAPIADADLIAFLEMGGTFADICDDTPGSLHEAIACEACHISGSMDVPGRGVVACEAGLGRVAAIDWPATLDVWVTVRDPVRMGRAPPFV